MSALFGWTGGPGNERGDDILTKMADAAHADGTATSKVSRPQSAAGVAGRGSTFAIVEAQGAWLALVGHPRRNGQLLTGDGASSHGEALLQALRTDPQRALGEVTGDFALAMHDSTTQRAVLAVDRMGIHPLSYQHRDGMLLFGSTLDAIAQHPAARLEVSSQAIFNYLFFHVVPGPGTIYRDAWRLPPGCMLLLEADRVSVAPYWKMTFREAASGDASVSAGRFLTALEEATAKAAAGSSCGTFLSGGTDSSTIAGMLKRSTGRARTYSIGFEEGGYDEMEYARLASRHFGTEHHEYYVTPSDVRDAAPRMAQTYDQPFGNASAIPTYFCARLARNDGIDRLLGGDGGDELFGGNARYGKQNLLAQYHRLPVALRRGVLEPMLLPSDLAKRLPLVRKVRSYIEQARPDMPARYESYNLLDHLGAARVLTPEFLASIDAEDPHRLMRDEHAQYREASLVNQMLGIDLRFTLADNDLPKVTRMCALADVDIAFPMLDDAVVDLSARLPSIDKLRGTTLRPFFKEALSNFLPGEIIRKKKHGFGLPVGEWLARDPGLRELARDNLEWLKSRGIVRPAFVDELCGTLLHEHPGYYGNMVWVLLVLALWMRGRQA